jgi:hypothetical protein
MRALRTMGLAVLLTAGLTATARAGWSVGVSFGGPVCVRPYWCGYPYYYRPYAVYVDAPPPVILPAAAPAVVYTTPPAVLPAPTPAPAAALAPPAVAAAGGAAPASFDALKARLGGADEKGRADAAVELGRLKDARAVEPLTRALQSDASPTVREAAARGLGLIGDASTLKALQYAAQADPDREVRHSAQFAAEGIRGALPR